MRSLLMILLAAVFLLRGFAGDAMAMDMALAQNGQKESESMQPDCHHLSTMQTEAASIASDPVAESNSHGDCGLCCVVIGLPPIIDLLSAAQPEILVRFDLPRFHSVIIQPAFKPPVL